ncbi:ribonuclease H-like domain-containing protein [Haloferula sp. A504]|uniref:ribonuclease H-like domain-containing protein n=1 Tax=Haloferula sp. A504 TaxID=3373601 RepID=UPI0031BCC6E2|nr:ribonuclease H-like domain-containing protein [Verrucomicrobiaceae bacterium E54]
MAGKNIVYFDLETQRSLTDVGRAKDKLGMSVGVTYSTGDGEYRIYGENEVDALIDQLLKADLVVGWNHVEFDYPVLQAYTIVDLPSQTVNLDMMLDLQETLGFRLKLDSAAKGSLGGEGKTADGLDALKWWQQHKKTGDLEPLMKIAEYCAYDVKVTKCVHEYGVEHGRLKYPDRAGHLQEVVVSWA